MYDLREIDFATTPPLVPSAPVTNPFGHPAWLQTLGGGAVDLVNPKPAQINFRVIAAALARVQRFGGHAEQSLTVAQHCVEGAYAILRDTGRRDWAAAFLLHDAHEAYIGDIATPVADALAALVERRRLGPCTNGIVKDAISSLKHRLDSAIYDAAGFLCFPLDSETADYVKVYDLRMCRTERDARLAPSPYVWCDAVENAEPVRGCDLDIWSEYTARSRFMSALRDLLPNTLK